MIINVDAKSANYDVVIEQGILEHANDFINLNRKVMVVTDKGVPVKYAEAIKEQSKEGFIFTIEGGEDSKSLESFAAIEEALLLNGFSRSDCVVAVGGGVVGDLAGFAAASFMRGIDFYNIPTTVLSQVDSSIGGKTAVNFKGVKNIVGAFYQPKKVLIDFNTLETLNDRQISNGLAEAIKMAMTFDAGLFSDIEKMNSKEEMYDVIARAVDIKRRVVEEDEKEAGLRKVLNFGHTLGHGIEMSTDGKLLHGECVALGMTLMCEGDARDRLLKVMKKIGLPTGCEYDYKNACEAISHDKKGNGDTVSAVLCKKIGYFELVKMSVSELGERLKNL